MKTFIEELRVRLPGVKFHSLFTPSKDQDPVYKMVSQYASTNAGLNRQVFDEILFNNPNLHHVHAATVADGYYGLAAHYLGEWVRQHKENEFPASQSYYAAIHAVLWAAVPQSTAVCPSASISKVFFEEFLGMVAANDNNLDEFTANFDFCIAMNIFDILSEYERFNLYKKDNSTAMYPGKYFFAPSNLPTNFDEFANKLVDTVEQAWSARCPSEDPDFMAGQLEILREAIYVYDEILNQNTTDGKWFEMLERDWRDGTEECEIAELKQRVATKIPEPVANLINLCGDDLIFFCCYDSSPKPSQEDDPEIDLHAPFDPHMGWAVKIPETDNEFLQHLRACYREAFRSDGLTEALFKSYFREYVTTRLNHLQKKMEPERINLVFEKLNCFLADDLSQAPSDYTWGKFEAYLDHLTDDTMFTIMEAKDGNYTRSEVRYQERNGSKIGRNISKAYQMAVDSKEQIATQGGEILKALKSFVVDPDDKKTELILQGKKFTFIGLLKRVIAGVALFNVGIMTGIVGVIIMWAKNRKATKNAKRKMQLMLEQEIAMVDEKIQDATSDGNRKAKYSLMRSKQQLENALNRIKWGVGVDATDEESPAVAKIRQRMAAGGRLKADDRLRVGNIDTRGLKKRGR